MLIIIIFFFVLFEVKMSFGNEFGKQPSPGAARARYSSKDYAQMNLSIAYKRGAILPL